MNDQFTSPSRGGPESSSSFLNPGGQSVDAKKHWASIVQLAKALRGTQGGAQLAHDLLRAQQQGGYYLLRTPHPFKIYNVPTVCVPNTNPAQDWLRYRVRAGLYLNTPVTGTDNVTNPDDDTIPMAGDPSDIILPAGQTTNYFWIDATGTPTIKTGTTTQTWDAQHILIGWVDTTPNSSTGPAIVRQVQRTDVVTATGSGGGYMGEYDPTKTYSAGMTIKITTGTVSQQALYFGVRPGKTAIPGQTPQFPIDPNGPWDCLGLAFQTIGVCSTGQKNINIQATAPF